MEIVFKLIARIFYAEFVSEWNKTVFKTVKEKLEREKRAREKKESNKIYFANNFIGFEPSLNYLEMRA